MRVSHLVGALTVLLLVASTAAAQETGSVAGIVVDRSGAPVAGATVRIAGDALSTPRTMVTSEKGQFGFSLLPGEYLADVEKTGVGHASRKIVIDVARETRCDVILGAIAAEQVSVQATATPEVDLKSPEVAFSYRRALVQELPLERSYLGLMQLIPGVAGSDGFAPNGGGSRQDNTFLMDSVNITNPFFGYLSTEINELDIADLDVKRGALRPEFGRSTGFVTDAVIKSGTNLLTGNYRFEAIPSHLVAESAKTVRSRTSRFDNAFDVGGPVQKDRLFFYASARIFRSSSPDAVNIFGPLPNSTERTEEYFGKFTARLGLRVLNVSFRNRPTSKDFAGIGAEDSPDVASNVDAVNRIANASYDWFLGNRTTVSVKFVHVAERNESKAVKDLGFEPEFEEDNVAGLGHVVIGGVAFGGASFTLNRQDYTRDDLKANVSHVFDAGRTTHQFKAGFEWDRGVEDLTRRSNGWGDISDVLIGGRLYVRATTYPEQPPQQSTGSTQSVFAQDDMTFGSRVTVNAGVLLNRDSYDQAATGTNPANFPTFGFSNEVQPRLGLAVQLRKGQGDKAYVTFGRYYGLDQKGGARAVAIGRLYTVDTDFDPVTGRIVSQTVSANTGTKAVAPGLEPPVTNEIVAGYAAPLGHGWSLDAFALARRSTHFIEDVPTVLPFANFQFQNDPFAERKYRTVTVELRRRLLNNWALNFSYAWSRLEGNYDQDYSGSFLGTPVFNTSSLIDDGPGAFTSDRFRYGPLSQDRPHVYKVLAFWMPKQVEHLSLGVFVRGQSGTPWEARGLPWDSGLTYLRFLEPAGAHRTPFWTNVDALMKYSIKVTPKQTLHFEARLLNVFNRETPLLVDQRLNLDPRNLTIAGTPAAGCWSCFTDAFQQGTLQVNTHYAQPVAYATPRRLLLSVLFDF